MSGCGKYFLCLHIIHNVVICCQAQFQFAIVNSTKLAILSLSKCVVQISDTSCPATWKSNKTAFFQQNLLCKTCYTKLNLNER